MNLRLRPNEAPPRRAGAAEPRGAAAAPRGWVAFPWLFLALVIGLIAFDNLRTGSTVAAPDRAAASFAAVRDGPLAIDPVCGMAVRKSRAEKASAGGRTAYFCSLACRDAFLRDPLARRIHRGRTMRGIPTSFYQGGVALVLILTFGLFELISWRKSKRGAVGTGIDARVSLTAWEPMRALLKLPWLRFALQAVTAAMFLLVVAAGLFGDQNPALNIAPLLTWTIWWAGLIFLVLYAGKAWCLVCPWDGLATWMEQLKFWGPRRGGLGLGLRWPPALRSIWPAVGLFLLLSWVELGMGITMIPRATAYVALGMLGLAVASVLLFDRKAFCRYGCLVGRVSGLYAMFSSIEVRADPNVCASCRTMDCYRGNERADGCPTFEFPKAMRLNTYCILCTDCFKSCPRDGMDLRLRPWGADLAAPGKPRADEAALSLILLSMTGFHGLTMTPSWPAWVQGTQAALGLSRTGAFSLLMTAVLLSPVALYAGLIGLSRLSSGNVGFRSLFLRYAYSLLPIALFYHLAHNAEHFLMEGPKVLALASDPFGWGWNIFGTAGWRPGPLVSLEGLWQLQVLFVLVGHVYSLWVSERTTRRLVPNRKQAFLTQLPLLAAMVAFSFFSLWLLKQPMAMRLSAM